MPYSEDDLLPISALQHLLFCERQCALIHLEQLWADNLFTAEGNHLHEKAHDGKPETRDGIRITRGLPLRSFRLGLIGQADVITWQPPSGQIPRGNLFAQALRAASSAERKQWIVRPVEYKRGRPKRNDCDRVQLCAQTLCLEEMLNIDIPDGDLFYGLNRRRTTVSFDSALRQTTRQAAQRLHQLIDSRVTPPAVKQKKCDTCSLLPLCLPAVGQRRSAKRFFQKSLDAAMRED